MTVHDPRIRACVKRDLKALDICPEMVDTVSRTSEYPDLFPVQPKAEAQSDLRIRCILDRIEFPDRHVRLFPVIIHQPFRYAVKITYDIIRLDLMVIEKFQSSVHSDHKFRIFTFNDWESEILLQHPPAYDHSPLTHDSSISP